MSVSWLRQLRPVSSAPFQLHQEPLILSEQVVALFGDELHAQDGGLGTSLF
jgi:hypothetical protein